VRTAANFAAKTRRTQSLRVGAKPSLRWAFELKAHAHAGTSSGLGLAEVSSLMRHCDCTHDHPLGRRIVLTGGPGAGKTAVLELARQHFCAHVKVLPESAGIVFGGGFPRGARDSARRCTQRAIFYVQRELETIMEDEDAAMVLCDRGTVDGHAYWPGPDDFWHSVGTTRTEQLGRYQTVIHLRTPALHNGYNHDNPLRVETPREAFEIDERIAQAWEGHPRRFFVDSTPDFLTKAHRAVEILRMEMPECCRRHIATLTPWRDEASLPR
jgi:predicted ATPase